MICDLEELSKTIPITAHTDTPQDNWANDTGRNSNDATFSGTFICYTTQLVIEVGETTQKQMTTLKKYIQKPIFSVRYLNSDKGEWVTEKFYGTSIPAKKDYWNGKYKSFSVTLTGVEARDEVL